MNPLSYNFGILHWTAAAGLAWFDLVGALGLGWSPGTFNLCLEGLEIPWHDDNSRVNSSSHFAIWKHDFVEVCCRMNDLGWCALILESFGSIDEGGF